MKRYILPLVLLLSCGCTNEIQNETVNSVICDVKKAYYNLQYALEAKKVAEDMVEKHAKGVLLSKTFKTDTRVYKYIYEFSRKKYNS